METELVLEKKASSSARIKTNSVKTSKTPSLKNKRVVKTVPKQEVKPEGANRPPPYHIFTVLGDYFVFDTSGCRFYKIEEPTYRFLELCLSCSIPEAKKTMLREGKFPEQTVKEIAKTISILSKNGLFDVPDFSISDEYLEKKLAVVESARWGSIN